MVFESVVKQDDIFKGFVVEKLFDRKEILLEYEEFSDEESDIIPRPGVGVVEIDFINKRIFNFFEIQI